MSTRNNSVNSTGGKKSTQHPQQASNSKRPVERSTGAQRLTTNKKAEHSAVDVSRECKHTPNVNGGAPKVALTNKKNNTPVANESQADAHGSAKRPTTPWTVEASSRVASVTATKGDGTVRKGSFAADAMSRAMKNERNGKVSK